MLQIKNVHKQYKTGNLIQKALDDVSLNLRDNEFVAILGPSGSGKTTLLNIIGGLDRYDKGDLIINEISTKNYRDRDWDSYRNHTIGFVFQSYNLIPHQTILSNVELALTISGISKKGRKQKALKALEEVGLASQAHKKPNQLSGGQMQRVAIARALVNDPDIVLADEPTGALDSETSVQVMELLKKVAKDRLVVMVTHNPELAENYATRIVNLKDGKILSDTAPYKVENENLKKAEHKNMGRTSMSFLTSLFLSFNNLKTKKGRTFLTSFAGSIGIIGIALILSLSNGVNTYIRSVEEDTLSEYPLQIQSTGIDMSSMLMGNTTDTNQKEEGDIQVADMVTSMFSTIGSNDLASLKQYLESSECPINNYAKAIEYQYSVQPKIYSSNTDKLRQINPDVSFSSLGIGSSTSSNSLMSSMMSTDVFYQMPQDKSLFENQYDIKAGNWPTNYNECVLVLTSNGNISDFMLYTLGLKDYEELDNMVNQFLKEENIETTKNADSYSYEDILGTTFKLIHSSDCYEYDSEYNIWRDKTDNTEYMKQIVEKGEDLTIVGIAQPKEDVTAAMLQTGIGYTSSLTNYVMEKAANSEIVKQQIESPEINVFTGKRFDATEEESGFDMNSLMEIDTKAIQAAFKIDQSKIKVDFSNLNQIATKNTLPTLDLNDILNKIEFSISADDIQTLIDEIFKGYETYIKEHPEGDWNQIGEQLTQYLQSKEAGELLKKEIENIIKENGELTITQEQLQKVMMNILKGYEEYAQENNFTDITKLEQSTKEYLESEEAKNIISNNLTKLVRSQNLEQQVSKIMEDYMKSVMTTMSKSLEKEMTKSINQLSKSMASAFTIDEEAFINAFHMKMNEEEMAELFASLMSKEKTTYESNLKKLDYTSLDKPGSISIYPKDFEGNEAITNLLNEYNDQMKQKGNEDKVISYTDMVGTLMSSVTTIVDVISYVLIAFVGISLVVSSIMIGVITYISVLERKKEIGILRAIGASKHNISQVFNAETFMIGLLAGIIGIGFTEILLVPINQIIYAISEGANVRASLPIMAAVILIILSTVLTLIGGIIPSKKAAKEDPVLALRSD